MITVPSPAFAVDFSSNFCSGVVSHGEDRHAAGLDHGTGISVARIGTMLGRKIERMREDEQHDHHRRDDETARHDGNRRTSARGESVIARSSNNRPIPRKASGGEWDSFVSWITSAKPTAGLRGLSCNVIFLSIHSRNDHETAPIGVPRVGRCARQKWSFRGSSVVCVVAKPRRCAGDRRKIWFFAVKFLPFGESIIIHCAAGGVTGAGRAK